ncbi:MAG: GreA/GreB family elongation factor [Elusimicrobiales bacterium]|nr:GreA/GreB family elongation factor [Elusimicrobiales bacterium]
MSRAFVRDDKEDPGEPVKRQPSGRPNYVTPAGLELLKAKAAELAWLRAGLVSKQRPDEARSLELRQAEMDIEYYETQIKRAILVDNRGQAAEDVRFGATVAVREPDGAVREYKLVGEDEADAASGKLNWGSPLAGALLGAAAGAKVMLPRKNGAVQLEIISVRYPKE